MASVQHIYLSPHYDDAALSCGGAIVRHDLASEAALVATIFGGKPDYARLSPFAHSIHARRVREPISSTCAWRKSRRR